MIVSRHGHTSHEAVAKAFRGDILQSIAEASSRFEGGMDIGLEALIRRLNETPPLTEQSASELRRVSHATAFERALQTGETMGVASGGLAILNQPEDQFRAELKSIDNDLPRQVAIVNEALDGWLSRGETPAPYYAWRVAVILGKAKRIDDEKAFLAAWCRHFGSVVGRRYEMLADRARTRGVIV